MGLRDFWVFNAMPYALCWSLLSDAHQGENSRQTEEKGRSPAWEKGGEHPRFSEGDKNIKDNSVGKANHHTNPDAHGYSPGPTGFQSKGNADQDHDQV